MELIKKVGRATVSLNAQIVRDKSGDPTAVQGVMRDISEHKPAWEAARRAGERTEQILRSVQSGVLVIDVNQKAAEIMLKKMGHTAVIANNGRETVTAYENQTFDLILMDGQMPVMDGMAATGAIRNVEGQSAMRNPLVQPIEPWMI